MIEMVKTLKQWKKLPYWEQGAKIVSVQSDVYTIRDIISSYRNMACERSETRELLYRELKVIEARLFLYEKFGRECL